MLEFGVVIHATADTNFRRSFLRYPGADATNWRGEQAIRPSVVNRKVWGGKRLSRHSTATDRGAVVFVQRTGNAEHAAAAGKELCLAVP
ncbi:hypothetical protein Poly41_57490 [Novipirellula artificiosorum]|uniref:Uncharacterized protein n=1 Tax=Novipirellula artificiosorum TaxID=2528016 RepID=A0A5C6D901_9BACT|nr:hypothetical protein Poly41_57490 [Novipirellula artificiosorum]